VINIVISLQLTVFR